LPNTKAGLYQQFTDALYEWKQDRFPTSSSQRQELNKALGELALRAIASEKTKFRLRHRLVESVLGKPDEELFQLALQLGWLNQVGVAAEAENRGEKVYAFYHPTFQEYFAAQAISDWHYFLNHTPHNPAHGTYRIFEPQWKEVILLWLGREDVPHEQKEELIRALVELEDGCGEFFFDGYRYRGFYEYRAYFLAAAGIAEFVGCSQSDEIVDQLVKWGFGYFNIEKQEWQTFLDSIEKGARATLAETDCSRAIRALLQLRKSAEDESTRWRAVYSLGKIGTGNKEVIAVLLQLLELTNESTRSQVAYFLGKIDPGNKEAISTLEQLLELTEKEAIRRLAAYNLGKIDPGNKQAVAALVQLLESTEKEVIRRRVAESLGEIGKGNKEVIAALVQLIESTEKVSILRRVAESLGKIGKGNKEAIAALVQLIESTEDEATRRRATESLGEIGKGNQRAIASLLQLLESTKNESTGRLAAYALGKIERGNQEAIATLVQLLESTKNESVRRQTAYNLKKIDPDNREALAVLVQLVESAKKESIRRQAAESLGEIGKGNEEAIAALVQLVESTKDESTRRRGTESLGEIGKGNESAIAALVQLLLSTQDESIRRQAADSLKKILLDDQFAGIITALKDYLSDKTYENDFGRFRDCYKLIWHCAQNMTYPAFYQALHTQPTPLTQSLNFANLPQSLSAAIANDSTLSQNIHLICLDGSKFIDRDNPAAKIYAQMVKSGCPKCEDGTPKTMPEFQTYWDLLQSDKRVVLVFYEGTPPNLPFVSGGTKGGGGFSESFLDALSKFDGAICVITTQELDNMPLKCIKQSQPIAEVVEWLKKVVLLVFTSWSRDFSPNTCQGHQVPLARIARNR
jgi:HEAT repeat protein